MERRSIRNFSSNKRIFDVVKDKNQLFLETKDKDKQVYLTPLDDVLNQIESFKDEITRTN